MTEAGLVTILMDQCPRVFPILAPAGTTRPYLTWQHTGGRDVVYANDQVADRAIPDFAIKAYADNPKAASDLMKSIDAALRDSGVEVESSTLPYGDVETDYTPWLYSYTRFYSLMLER